MIAAEKLCQRRGCSREATHALKLCVPYVQAPEGAPPAEMLMGVLVCEPCLDGADPDPWLSGETGASLRGLFTISMAPGAPDFDNAEMAGVSIHSPEYGAIALHTPRKPN